MKHVLAHLAQAAARPLSCETTGAPRSANSAAPQGCEGAGYGVPNPMSTVVQPVPAEVAHALSAAAQGIVTRMGQDPQGLGGAAIEPGPAGMRPASSAACWGACGVCDCAAAAERPCPDAQHGRGRQRGGAPTIPDGNHGDNQKEATE